MPTGKMEGKLKEMMGLIERLKTEYPAQAGSFLAFMEKTESTPVLSMREKELINVALSVAGQCEWCIAFHVKNAIGAGATRDELMESGFMAVIMHGGPAMAYLTPLIEALDDFLPAED